jgi:Flp pilus assembly protein TadG
MSRMKSSRRCQRRSETGNATVELVVVLPATMLVILLAVQVVLWSQAAGLVQEAAAVGAETSAGLGGSSASGESAALGYLADHGLSKGATVTASRTSDGVAEVRVVAVPTEILPFGSVHVSASRSEPVQGFRESG